MTLVRRAGVLLHPSSLPSGCLDDDAKRWIDWLASCGFRVWQMLPLGLPLDGVSPYQCVSAFALNPALFPSDLPKVPSNSKAFQAWHARQREWIDDFALFMVIKRHQDNAPWVDWPADLRDRDPKALLDFQTTHRQEIRRIIRQQYQLYVHWQRLRAYAGSKHIILFGDMPIFVAHDSADVWLNRHCFLLDEAGQPTLVAGVPPDYFSATGQRWGNPQYNWDDMQQAGFVWWRERLRYHFECFDLVRIDHFRGLAASWMIPAQAATAVDGYWQTVPGAALLQSIHDAMGDLPLVAEDLGVITPDVNALRERFALPGMSVLQFAFDAFADNPHKPENVGERRVYYTGTHDNDTAVGWFAGLDLPTQQRVLSLLSISQSADVPDAMLKVVLSSRAAMAIIPLQDLLALGSEARMNTPGTAHGNWGWRFEWSMIPPELAGRLHSRLIENERIPDA